MNWLDIDHEQSISDAARTTRGEPNQDVFDR